MPYVSPSCKIKIWLTSNPLRLYSNDSYTYNIQKNYSFIDLVFILYSLGIPILMILGFSISKKLWLHPEINGSHNSSTGQTWNHNYNTVKWKTLNQKNTMSENIKSYL